MHIYAIRDAACPEAGVSHMIRAKSPKQARSKAQPKLVATLATQDEVLDWARADKPILSAGESDEHF